MLCARNRTRQHAHQPGNTDEGDRAWLPRSARTPPEGSRMTSAGPLLPFFRRLEDFSTFRWMGRVTKVVDYLVESEGPFCSVGEGCAILTSDGRTLAGEIVGFRGKTV